MKIEKQKTILLVEDERSTAMIETVILNNYGFNVICANTGEKAVEEIAKSPDIDLVLMDINLGPGIDGTDAAEIILNMREVPLIFLSSHTEREVVEKTEGITSYGYIVKNTGETVLIASIKMAFRLFEARKLEKEKETALRAEKDFNQMLVQSSPAFFVAIGSDGKTLMMNDSMLQALGYSAEEATGRDYMTTFVPHADRKELTAVFEQIVKKRETTININRVLARNGRELICEWRGIPVFKGAEYNFFLGVGIDITDKKRAEMEAIEHRTFRNRLFESSKLPIIVMNATTFQYIDCNPAAVAIYGFKSIDQVLNKTPLDFSAPEQYDGTSSSEKAKFYINKALTEGLIVFEWLHQRQNGVKWDAEVHLMRFHSDDKEYLQFTLIDITERKRIETALKESEILHTAVIDSTSDLIWSMDAKDFKLLTFNRGFKDYFSRLGIQLKKGMGENELLPDAAYIKIWDGFFNKAIELGTFTTEYKSVGNRILQLNLHALKLDDVLIGVSIFGKDITEQKIAENELKKSYENLTKLSHDLEVSEQKYHQIFENAPIGIFQRELEGKYIYFNPAIVEQFECKSQEEFLKNYSNIPQRWTEPEKHNEFKELLLKNNKVFGYEVKSRLIDGKIKWFSLFVHLDRSNMQINGFSMDITERKQAEEELRWSERKYRNIYENSIEGLFRTSIDGKILNANPALAKMAGFDSQEELISAADSGYKFYVYSEDRKKLVGALKEKGSAEPIEIELIRKNGEKAWALIKAHLAMDETGNLTCIEGSIEDITARKKSEEKIKASLLEKEALLRELYHRTKNNMQVICAMLAMHSFKTDNAELKIVFKDMETRIHSMALVHQKLYKSKDLSNINLNEYVVELANLLMKSYNKSQDRISIELNVENISVLIDNAIPCGLILNELISNSLKYAFPGERTGKISLSIVKREQNIEINYSDDGIGLPEGFDYRNDGKMGFQSVISIVEDQLLGNISIVREKGFNCRISFKNTLYKERI